MIKLIFQYINDQIALKLLDSILLKIAVDNHCESLSKIPSGVFW